MIYYDIHRPVTPIICDRCGEEFDWMPDLVMGSRNDPYWVDPTDEDAEFQAEDAGWLIGCDETVCPECREKEDY